MRLLVPGALAVLVLVLVVGAPQSSVAGEELGGRYLLSQRTVVVANVPILPDLSTETWSVSLLDLTATADQLRGRGKLCHIEMKSSSSLVRTELPVELQRLLSDVRLDARLTPLAGGFSLHQPPRVLVLGANLEDPEREALPSHAGDPRVTDQDGDGNPGVTVRVRGIVNGEVYVVQRGSAGLEGRSDPHGFHGTVPFRSEDVVVGASKPVLMRRTKTRPDPSRSNFVLRKVAASLDCSGAVALARRVH